MEWNYLGLVSALAVFLGVWWGHVAVRYVESISVQLWKPMLVAALAGLALEVVSVQTESIYLSAACGIMGMTLLWDSFEFYRQQKRIKRGHAPANPKNPRHAQILATHPGATTLDLLNRDPRGEPYTPEEIDGMKVDAK